MIARRTYRFKIASANRGKTTALCALAAGPWRKGLNFAVEMAKAHRPASAYALHAHTYLALRRMGLPAQLACACRDKAFEAYRSRQALRESDPGHRRFPHFDSTPAIRLNIPRSCRLFRRGPQYWIEVTTPQERMALRVAGKATALARVWTAGPTHGEIVFADDELSFHVAVPTPAQKPSATERQTWVGVDVNVFGHLIVAAALNASGQIRSTFWIPAGRFNWKRKHFGHVRDALQRAGARRKVKQLKDREHRFVEAFLHEATTRLVRWARRFPAPFVALEDLRGIRRKVGRARSWNRKLHSWPFRSGQAMVSYKGLSEGMLVKPLRGAFSSRYCSRCGSHTTRRSGAAFACLDCGYGLNAHLLGAVNMAWRAARYTQAAAGRAGQQTAERQSGPDAGERDAIPHGLIAPSVRISAVSPRKPVTSVTGS